LTIKHQHHQTHLFSLIIEDDPKVEFEKCLPVQPQGCISQEDAADLGLSLYKLGIKEKLWSEDAIMFLVPICIGFGELSDPNLPLQEFFCGVSSSLNRLGKLERGVFLFDYSVIQSDAVSDMWKMICDSKPIVEPPYCIPFTIFDKKPSLSEQKKLSKQTISAFNQLGKKYYGIGATSVPLPVDCSNACSH